MSETHSAILPPFNCPDPRLPQHVGKILPLLDAPVEPMRIVTYPASAPGRERPEQVIRDVFRHTYGARVEAFYPLLLAFEGAGGVHAALGLRDGGNAHFFSEHYLDAPAQHRLGEACGTAVRRETMVELGNLAVTDPGQARWLIAALTAYLHAAGYRWVLFTLVPALYNAFRRMGVMVIDLGDADPARLPDAGASWGSYYQRRPRVCVGDIDAGFRTLSAVIGSSSPEARRLWRDAGFKGAAARFRRLDTAEAMPA